MKIKRNKVYFFNILFLLFLVVFVLFLFVKCFIVDERLVVFVGIIGVRVFSELGGAVIFLFEKKL